MALHFPREGRSLRRLVWSGDDNFRIETEAEPHSPPERHLLLRVRAVGICGTDIHILRGDLPGARPPLVLGHEICGEVYAVGDQVSRLKVGDRVTVDSVVGCGHCYFCRKGSKQFCKTGFEFGINRDGGCQDFLTVPEENAFHISDRISFEEGAILDMEVYSALNRCGVRAGDVALVVGDGPAGLIACQLLRHMGASKIILSGQSPSRIMKARQLGLAHRVIDSRCEDLRAAIREETDDLGANIAVDCAGTPRSLKDTFRSVIAGGTVLLYAVYAQGISDFDVNQIVLQDLRVFGALSDRHGWESIIELVERGILQLNSLITHTFSLEQASEAFESVRNRNDRVLKAVFVL